MLLLLLLAMNKIKVALSHYCCRTTLQCIVHYAQYTQQNKRRTLRMQKATDVCTLTTINCIYCLYARDNQLYTHDNQLYILSVRSRQSTVYTVTTINCIYCLYAHDNQLYILSASDEQERLSHLLFYAFYTVSQKNCTILFLQ